MAKKDTYFTVQRDGMDIDDLKSPALYFGTTTGQLWMGRDGGEDWSCPVMLQITPKMQILYTSGARRLSPRTLTSDHEAGKSVMMENRSWRTPDWRQRTNSLPKTRPRTGSK